jgi:hypothetical protein
MPGHGRQRPPAIAVLAAAALCGALALASLASAEVAQKDGVRVSVAGRMTPTKLPRSGGAPIAVSVAGHIAPTVPGELPRLERIAISINSHGKLRSRSIPRCRLGHIEPSTTQEALAACRPALIGEGHFSANVKIAEQSPFPSEGKVLAFNGKLGGKPAIFAHIYGTDPVPTSYVLPFLIKKERGAYGSVLEAALPDVTGEWGYVTGVSLGLQPRFVSASCPAPAGFLRVSFPLMQTRFGFAGGVELTSTLVRSCRVR